MLKVKAKDVKVGQTFYFQESGIGKYPCIMMNQTSVVLKKFQGKNLEARQYYLFVLQGEVCWTDPEREMFVVS